jgi:hypothetical protein
MIDTYQLENQRIKQELAALRQAIVQAEPVVMYDGRFDEMIASPITAVTIAKQLLTELTSTQQEHTLLQ